MSSCDIIHHIRLQVLCQWLGRQRVGSGGHEGPGVQWNMWYIYIHIYTIYMGMLSYVMLCYNGFYIQEMTCYTQVMACKSELWGCKTRILMLQKSKRRRDLKCRCGGRISCGRSMLMFDLWNLTIWEDLILMPWRLQGCVFFLFHDQLVDGLSPRKIRIIHVYPIIIPLFTVFYSYQQLPK